MHSKYHSLWNILFYQKHGNTKTNLYAILIQEHLLDIIYDLKLLGILGNSVIYPILLASCLFSLCQTILDYHSFEHSWEHILCNLGEFQQRILLCFILSSIALGWAHSSIWKTMRSEWKYFNSCFAL